MSNEISNQKFYRFLANFQQGEQTWADVADAEYGNDNGSVIKAEFRKFMQAEWGKWNGEEGGTLSNSVINNFWKKLDTNTKGAELNKLSDAEMDKMNGKIEAYVQLNEFVEKNVTRPTVLKTTGAKWEADVADDLAKIVEEWIKNGSQGDLDAILLEKLPEIQNSNTAQYCAVEYQETLKKGILKDYPEYNVALDDTLNNIIEEYLKTVNGETDPDGIYNAIKGIMDAYMATAGLGSGSNVDLSQYGYVQENTDGLNNIQRSVAEQKIKNNLSGLKNEADYKEYQADYDNAIAKFTARLLDETTVEGFNALLQTAVADFKESPEGKNLNNIVKVKKDYTNLTTSSEFYNVLVEKFGKNLADIIAQDGKYVTAYNELINEVVTQLEAGKLVDADGNIDTNAVQQYVLDGIAKNLDKYFPNGLKDLSIENLNKMYDVRANSADADPDKETALSIHRDAALDYCEALCSKHKDYEKLVTSESMFGENWREEIGKMLPSAIKSKMAILKAEALKLNPVYLDSNTPVNWTGAAEMTMTAGSTKELELSASIASVDKADITYDAEIISGSGNVNVSDLGKVSVTASDASGHIKINVYAVVDGERVGAPKVVTVTVNEKPDAKTLAQNSKTLNDAATGTIDTGKLVRTRTFAESGVTATATTKVADFVNGLKSGLLEDGFTDAQVYYAITTTINYYTKLISALTDQTGTGTGEWEYAVDFTYTDANGNSVNTSSTHGHSSRRQEKNLKNKFGNSGVCIHEDVRGMGKNEWGIVVDKATVIAKLKEFLGAV